MLYRFAALVVSVLTVALLAVGCGGGTTASTPAPSGPRTVSVEGTEFKFAPTDLTLKAGEKVKITLVNKGAVVHTWVMFGTDGKTELVKVKADVGKSESKEFTAPAAGGYKIVCDEPGHEQSGMVGKVTVQ